MPPHALLTVSDFSTVVTSSDREGRGRMCGMLPVVFDGHVYPAANPRGRRRARMV